MVEHSNIPSSSTAYCDCLSALQNHCVGHNFNLEHSSIPTDPLRHDSDLGRLCYTIAILSMFALILLLLMVRSIKTSKSAIEMEQLLDAMRFREELDLHQRQKRKLQKAKKKVTAWLTKKDGKLWSSSPQIILPPNRQNSLPNRQNSLQSSSSFIPEIVISNTEEGYPKRLNSYTPSLSLIYDFNASRKNSTFSDISVASDFFHGADTFEAETEYEETRQQSASRADTGESAASAPAAALAACETVKQKDRLPIRHSSTSSLTPGPHRYPLVHEMVVDMG